MKPVATGKDFAEPVKLIGRRPGPQGRITDGRAIQALGSENGYDYSFVPGDGPTCLRREADACVAG